MRVAILTFRGHAYYPHLLIKSVLSSGHDFRIFAPAGQESEYRDIVGDLRCFQFFDRPRIRDPRNFFLMRQLRSFLREFNPDVVHLLAFHPWLIFMKRILSRYPLVVTVHDPRKHAGDISSKIIPGSEKFFYKSAAQIITLGAVMKDTIVNEDKVPEGKVTVIRHGDYEIYTRWAGKDIPEHPATVLFLAGFMPTRASNT